MINTRINICLFLAAGLVLPGCNERIEPENTGEHALRYSVSMASNNIDTKGTPLNTTGDWDDFETYYTAFTFRAYNEDDGKDFTYTPTGGSEVNYGSSNQLVEYHHSKWDKWEVKGELEENDVPEKFVWKDVDFPTVKFYAYAPYNCSEITSIGNTGMTLTHTVPTDVSNQQDIVLGYFCGNGGTTGTAAIQFYHPLTAVQFKLGLMGEVNCINSLSIYNVYDGGVATFTEGGFNTTTGTTVSWTPSSTMIDHLTQDFTSAPIEYASSTNVGETFILVPQDLSSEHVLVCTNVNVTTTSGDIDMDLWAELNTGNWYPGFIHTYSLKYGIDGNTLLPTLTIEPWVLSQNDIDL